MRISTTPLLFIWFEDRIMGQVQVSRNHVSGYRVETILFR